MLKGALLAVVLLACTAVGRSLSGARRRRAESLSELLAAIRVLRLRMLNSMEPLGILLRKSDCRLFRMLGNDLRGGANLYDCWRERCEAESRRGGAMDSLTTDDVILLNGFFKHLGGSGREEQSELFSGVIAEMEMAQTHARRSYADASKVYTALGTLVGIGLCVLIV